MFPEDSVRDVLLADKTFQADQVAYRYELSLHEDNFLFNLECVNNSYIRGSTGLLQ